MTPRRVCCIVNPIAGSIRRPLFEQVVAALRGRGCGVEIRPTAGPGESMAMAREAARSGAFEAIVAVGGDGTINEVANGLYGTPVPLAIVPAGTANVLALELALPRAPAALAQMIATAPARAFHPGMANDRLFLAMASCGFDGRVLAGVSPAVKKWIGKGAYVWSGARTWLAGGLSTITVTVDGSALDAGWVIVANSRRYAGRFVLAPEADPFAPGFQLVIMPGRARTDMARYISALLMGRLGDLGDCTRMTVERLRIDGPEGELFEVDGDKSGHLPLEIRPSPDPLMVIA